MHPGKSRYEHIDEFHKLVGDLAAIDTAMSDEDHALLLLIYLPSSYDNFMETLLYGWDTLKLEDVLTTLNSREPQKMTEAKVDGGEGLYVRGRSGRRDMKHDTDSAWSKSQGRSSRLMCYICQSEEHLKRDCPRYNQKKSQGFVRNKDRVSGSGADEYDSVDVMIAMSVEEQECRVRETGKVQVHMRDGSSFVLDNVRRTGNDKEDIEGRKQLGEKHTGWKIKIGTQQQNGLVEETIMTLLAKVRCLLILSGLSKVFWAEDTTMSTYLVNRSPSLTIGFKTPIDMLRFLGWLSSIKQGMLEPVKVKCIFLGCREGIVGNKLWRLDTVTSKVVLYMNMGFNKSGEYKKTFIGSGVVACEVISKWKTRLKEEMDVRSDLYMLSNDCRKSSDNIEGYYWEYTPGLMDEAKDNILDVGLLDGFDRGLRTDVQVFVDFDYAMGR
ncbi:zinc finger, CCHC-type containing protein [Tanacetum coccineum]|uniref:Zinc finger, CCHC-type containing protein n=1 Tax=Tanacetum coccineum TaxID=301880 RepID=A0ABQ5A7C7_9ASTR